MIDLLRRSAPSPSAKLSAPLQAKLSAAAKRTASTLSDEKRKIVRAANKSSLQCASSDNKTSAKPPKAASLRRGQLLCQALCKRVARKNEAPLDSARFSSVLFRVF